MLQLMHNKQSISNENNIHLKYLIANEQDALWGLTVNSVGCQYIAPHSHYPPGNHPARYLFSTNKGRILDEYQLVYISAGKGSFMTKSCRQQAVHEGVMFLLFPGEWHNYMPDKATGWNEYWIGFKGINIDNRVESGFFHKQKPAFNVGLSDKLVELYMSAIQIATEQKAGFQQMLAGIVNQLLGITYSLDKNQTFENSQIINQMNKAKIIMTEHVFSGIKAEEVAETVNMSYSWFRKTFKDYTGFAPAQYLLELRLQKAKEMLTNSAFSAKEIGLRIGFENHEYFFTAFRKKNKMTPIEYRKLTQKAER